MTLRDAAHRFFSVLARHPTAGRPVAPYPLDLHLVAPDDAAVVRLRDGALSESSEGAEPIGYWSLELRAERDVFDEIFEGRSTLGQAFYAGRLVAPEEKAKHNLVSAVGMTVRLVQEARRLDDPAGDGG